MLNRPLPPGRRAPRSAIVKCASNIDDASAPTSQEKEVPRADVEGAADSANEKLETACPIEVSVVDVRIEPAADVHTAAYEERDLPSSTGTIVAATAETPSSIVDEVESCVGTAKHDAKDDEASEPPTPYVEVEPTPDVAHEAEAPHEDASGETTTERSSVSSLQGQEDTPSSAENVEWYGLDQVTQPWTSVPELPPVESLDCVFNDDARALQKLILRVVKWCTHGDKLKLEEFKINSRLYGNGFMDPDEYTQSMATELGPLNMLVIVPCMLRIQPDALKKQLLYIALQTYRTKNLAKLQALVARG